MAGKTYSVSTLNRSVRQALEADFKDIWVEGEISNLMRPSSGHLYFSLKDDEAQVSCALFRGSQHKLQLPVLEVANGLAVRVHARVSLYEPRGNYQLIVDQMALAGIGALEQAFITRRDALQKEGLFAQARKRPLPVRPKSIGLITSASGAALHDALTTLARRNPLVSVVVYPSLVQGELAPAQLIAQIKTANRRKECEVLLLIRGGGSLEDLWAYNDEALVRAIVASEIPIVSGVGHEVDVTLADFAADLRAPTPTAAAELSCANVSEDIEALKSCQLKLQQQMHYALTGHQQILAHWQQRLLAQNPQRLLERQAQRADELGLRLQQVIERSVKLARGQLTPWAERLSLELLQRRLQAAQRNIFNLHASLLRLQQQRMMQAQQLLQHSMQALHHLSPLNILERGFAVVQNAQHEVVSQAHAVQTGERVTVRLAKGRLVCEVRRRLK
ncbi:exodeoxyribonuclease VII large subunit [Rappaport israeli]|uniref:exodeoxyribonuclease VII large subunit n=1 Tax=Rappaport israeli TaxID=1839807 RepID=UPI000931BFFD|nr:exodeoxyribonuclease VII large subunit [Rappaport israeli]